MKRRRTKFTLLLIASALVILSAAAFGLRQRYEDGLIYMDDIGSEFPRFNWINSQTALKEIGLNGRLLIRGEDMPHHEKMVLCIE